MTLYNATPPEIKTEHAVAPIIYNMRFQINFELFHSPNELNCRVAKWVVFAEKDSGFREQRQYMILHHNWTCQRIEVRIADFFVVQRHQRKHQHILRKQKIVKAEQNRGLEKFKIRHQTGIRHHHRIRLSESFKYAYLGKCTRKVAAGGVSGHDYLLRIYPKLFKSLRNNPAINLEAVTERNRKWVLRRQPVIHRKHDDVVFGHHVGPLSRIILMLKAAHAHERATMEMQNDFLNPILKILLSRRLIYNLLFILRLASQEAAGVAFLGLGVNHHFFRTKR